MIFNIVMLSAGWYRSYGRNAAAVVLWSIYYIVRAGTGTGEHLRQSLLGVSFVYKQYYYNIILRTHARTVQWAVQAIISPLR